MDFFEILTAIMVASRDNGKEFTDTARIEKIDSLLWNSRYRRVNHRGLYYLYAAKPLSELKNPIVVSSHIDCVMTSFFTRENGGDFLLGTYDNCITNAAILQLMLTGQLPDNVIVAFTGDEEVDSTGASDLARDLRRMGKEPAITVVLDVTDMGWDTAAPFTIENNFWPDALGRQIIAAAADLPWDWKFVPSDETDIPKYISSRYIIAEEAECDESWEYDEQNFPCFSLCLPVDGPMHSSAGVLARKSSCQIYPEALRRILHCLADSLSQ